jgi:hypothetical protein
MTDDGYQPVAVSRRICAPVHDIFQVLANPVRHPEFDGSEMLRGAVSTAVISRVEDVFVMKMYYSEIGDYEMNNHVVEYEPDRRIGWEPECGRGHPQRRTGQRGADPLGTAVELPAHPRWTGCDHRDRGLRLFGCTGARALGDGQRQDLGRGHGQDPGAA